MKAAAVLTSMALVIGAPSGAFAWGGNAHRAIADIAAARMSPKALRKAEQLLAATDTGLVGPTFEDAAVWADVMRDSSAEARALTASWHYVNLEVGAEDVAAACPQVPFEAGRVSTTGQGACLLTKIDDFIRTLSDPRQSDRERGLALRYLTHFVGEAHQPLHAASSCRDAGGNAERIETVSGRDTSLHGYWDTTVVTDLARNPKALAKTLNAQITPSQARAWSGAKTSSWIAESHTLAVEIAYRYGGPNACARSRSVTRLSPAYEERARAVAGQQIQKAGVRLAAVLNAVLD